MRNERKPISLSRSVLKNVLRGRVVVVGHAVEVNPPRRRKRRLDDRVDLLGDALANRGGILFVLLVLSVLLGRGRQRFGRRGRLQLLDVLLQRFDPLGQSRGVIGGRLVRRDIARALRRGRWPASVGSLLPTTFFSQA